MVVAVGDQDAAFAVKRDRPGVRQLALLAAVLAPRALQHSFGIEPANTAAAPFADEDVAVVRNHHVEWILQMLLAELAQEVPFRVEHLNAVIARVGGEEPIVLVEEQRSNPLKLARLQT